MIGLTLTSIGKSPTTCHIFWSSARDVIFRPNNSNVEPYYLIIKVS